MCRDINRKRKKKSQRRKEEEWWLRNQLQWYLCSCPHRSHPARKGSEEMRESEGERRNPVKWWETDSESEKQAWFPDGRVADKQKLEQVIAEIKSNQIKRNPRSVTLSSPNLFLSNKNTYYSLLIIATLSLLCAMRSPLFQHQNFSSPSPVPPFN